jgi:hypothetical protein
MASGVAKTSAKTKQRGMADWKNGFCIIMGKLFCDVFILLKK